MHVTAELRHYISKELKFAKHSRQPYRDHQRLLIDKISVINSMAASAIQH